jgi:thiamine biosynthesis lipoprotein ApbE
MGGENIDSEQFVKNSDWEIDSNSIAKGYVIAGEMEIVGKLEAVSGIDPRIGRPEAVRK